MLQCSMKFNGAIRRSHICLQIHAADSPGLMAEAFATIDPHLAKPQRYAILAEEIAAVVAGERDIVARMATVAALLAAAFPDFLWTGFYRVDPENPAELVVAPYQGTLGCLRIAIGRGVCGRAAAERRTLVVPDVEAFPGHIACDGRSRSEIVVPVIDAAGDLLAVLDIDSARLAEFDDDDARGLEQIVRAVFGG
jgi:GAF domain-containing protein